MQVTVFGAAEGLGGAVVREAVTAGHEVTAAVPSGDAARTTVGLGAAETVVVAPARDEGVADAVAGRDAVVFVPDRRRITSDALAVSAVRVTDAMADAGVRRFVALAGASARGQAGDRTLALRCYDTLRGFRGPTVAAERGFAGRVADTDLDWTVARAARLTDGPGDGVFQHGYRRVGVRDEVSRANAATFLVSVAGSDSYLHGMPIVTEKMEPRTRSVGPIATGSPAGR